jgi:hypothetical protein
VNRDFYDEVAAEIEAAPLPAPKPVHVEITPERAVALRGEMIRLAHNGLASSPQDVVARAEAYFDYIVNGAKSK